jgi:hypothetical protein
MNDDGKDFKAYLAHVGILQLEQSRLQSRAARGVEVVPQSVDSITEGGKTARVGRRLAAQQSLLRHCRRNLLSNKLVCLDEELLNELVRRTRLKDVLRLGNVLIIGLVQQPQRRDLALSDTVAVLPGKLREFLQ